MLMIFLFSNEPGSDSSSTSLWFARFLMHVFSEDTAQFIVRKGAHFTIYTCLGFCVYRALPAMKHKWLIALLICVLYAASDEWHQSFIPNRSAALKDVLLDSCGSGLGLLLSSLLVKKQN